MMRLILTYIIMVCVLTANAQTFTDRLQTSSAGDGSVRVTQSDDISALVNGKINVNANVNSNANVNTSSNANANANANAGKTVETKATLTTAKPSAEKSAASVATSPAQNDAATDSPAADTSKKVIVNAQKVQGYRVQVFTGGNSRADKTKAESIGDQIKRLFPDQPVYVHFYSPRWICRMGNYRTYEEGQAMLVRVRAAGFTQASLVKGTITPTD